MEHISPVSETWSLNRWTPLGESPPDSLKGKQQQAFLESPDLQSWQLPGCLSVLFPMHHSASPQPSPLYFSLSPTHPRVPVNLHPYEAIGPDPLGLPFQNQSHGALNTVYHLPSFLCLCPHLPVNDLKSCVLYRNAFQNSSLRKIPGNDRFPRYLLSGWSKSLFGFFH